MFSAPDQFPERTRRQNAALSVCLLLLLLTGVSSHALEFKNKLLEVIDRKFGSDAVERLIEWRTLAHQLKQEHRPTSEQELKQLRQVNDFFNRARFVDDIELWNSKDYWATPVELLAKNAGDCEDYAIAKYFTLLYAGFDEAKLQISYVKAIELNRAHMVLAYYETPASDPLILDNIKPEIMPASLRTDLLPVYSFNGLGLWLNRFERENAKRIGDATAMDQWSDMIRRQGILILESKSTD